MKLLSQIGTGLLVVLGIAGVVGYMLLWDLYRKGGLSSAHVIGNTIVVTSEVEDHDKDGTRRTGRVFGVDVDSHQIRWRKLSSADGCIAADAERMWCALPGSVTLRRASDYSVVAKDSAVAAAVPMGLRSKSQARVQDGLVRVSANDGRDYLVDTALKATPATDQASHARTFDNLLSAQALQALAGGAHLGFDMMDSSPRRKLHSNRRPLAGDEGWIKAVILAQLDSDLAIEPSGPPGAFILHRDSLDTSRAHILVTRVDAGGKTLWTAPLTMDALGGHLAGAQLVVATRGGLVFLDAATGQQRAYTSL